LKLFMLIFTCQENTGLSLQIIAGLSIESQHLIVENIDKEKKG